MRDSAAKTAPKCFPEQSLRSDDLLRMLAISPIKRFLPHSERLEPNIV